MYAPADLVGMRSPGSALFPSGARVLFVAERTERRRRRTARVPRRCDIRPVRKGASPGDMPELGEEIELVPGAGFPLGQHLAKWHMRCNGFSPYCTRACGCPLPSCLRCDQRKSGGKLLCPCGERFTSATGRKAHLQAALGPCRMPGHGPLNPAGPARCAAAAVCLASSEEQTAGEDLFAVREAARHHGWIAAARHRQERP